MNKQEIAGLLQDQGNRLSFMSDWLAAHSKSLKELADMSDSLRDAVLALPDAAPPPEPEPEPHHYNPHGK